MGIVFVLIIILFIILVCGSVYYGCVFFQPYPTPKLESSIESFVVNTGTQVDEYIRRGTERLSERAKVPRPAKFRQSALLGPNPETPVGANYGIKQSAEVCQSMCEKDDNCSAYYYNLVTGICDGYYVRSTIPLQVEQLAGAGIYGAREVEPTCDVKWTDPRFTKFMYDAEPRNKAKYKASATSATKRKCADVCSADPFCKSMAFEPQMFDKHAGTCYTSSESNGGYGLLGKGWVVADKLRPLDIDTRKPADWTDVRYESYNYDGGATLCNYSVIGSANASIAMCANACDNDETCAAFSYNPITKTCYTSPDPWYAHATQRQDNNTSVHPTAANRKPRFADSRYDEVLNRNAYVKFSGSNISIPEAGDAFACASNCTANSNCQSFMYDALKDTCILSSAKYNDGVKGNTLLSATELLVGVDLRGNVVANKATYKPVKKSSTLPNPYPSDFEDFSTTKSVEVGSDAADKKMSVMNEYSDCMDSCRQDPWCRSVVYDMESTRCYMYGNHISSNESAPITYGVDSSTIISANKRYEKLVIKPSESLWESPVMNGGLPYAALNAGRDLFKEGRVPKFSTMSDCVNAASRDGGCKAVYHGELANGCVCLPTRVSNVDKAQDKYGSVINHVKVKTCLDGWNEVQNRQSYGSNVRREWTTVENCKLACDNTQDCTSISVSSNVSSPDGVRQCVIKAAGSVTDDPKMRPPGPWNIWTKPRGDVVSSDSIDERRSNWGKWGNYHQEKFTIRTGNTKSMNGSVENCKRVCESDVLCEGFVRNNIDDAADARCEFKSFIPSKPGPDTYKRNGDWDMYVRDVTKRTAPPTYNPPKLEFGAFEIDDWRNRCKFYSTTNENIFKTQTAIRDTFEREKPLKIVVPFSSWLGLSPIFNDALAIGGNTAYYMVSPAFRVSSSTKATLKGEVDDNLYLFVNGQSQLVQKNEVGGVTIASIEYQFVPNTEYWIVLGVYNGGGAGYWRPNAALQEIQTKLLKPTISPTRFIRFPYNDWKSKCKFFASIDETVFQDVNISINVLELQNKLLTNVPSSKWVGMSPVFTDSLAIGAGYTYCMMSPSFWVSMQVRGELDGKVDDNLYFFVNGKSQQVTRSERDGATFASAKYTFDPYIEYTIIIAVSNGGAAGYWEPANALQNVLQNLVMPIPNAPDGTPPPDEPPPAVYVAYNYSEWQGACRFYLTQNEMMFKDSSVEIAKFEREQRLQISIPSSNWVGLSPVFDGDLAIGGNYCYYMISPTFWVSSRVQGELYGSADDKLYFFVNGESQLVSRTENGNVSCSYQFEPAREYWFVIAVYNGGGPGFWKPMMGLNGVMNVLSKKVTQ